MTTLCNALPPLAVTDLADRGGMNSKTLGDCLVSLGAGPDLPHDIIRDFELGYLGSVSGAPMPLSVFRVLQGSSSDDVSGIHAAGVPAEVPGMAATSGGGAPNNDQSGTVHAHLPAVQNNVSVMARLRASTFLERVRDAFIRRVRDKISDGRSEPRKFCSAHGPAASRVAVLPIPVVVRSAESEGVMRPDAAVKFTKSFGHKHIMSYGRSCCLLAAHIVLGVPTE